MKINPVSDPQCRAGVLCNRIYKPIQAPHIYFYVNWQTWLPQQQPSALGDWHKHLSPTISYLPPRDNNYLALSSPDISLIIKKRIKVKLNQLGSLIFRIYKAQGASEA